MPLTPIDIQQKTFGPELRGYNMDEVDDFLDEVVATLKDYDQRVRDAQDRIRALEAEVATRGEDETAISRALVAAQKQADALVAEAHAEAESIRSDAHTESDRLRADRDAERLSLTQDLARMRATVADLKRRVVELASSAETDLDRMDTAIAEAATEIGEDFSDGPAPTDAEELQPVYESEEADIGDWGRASDDFETPSAGAWGQADAVAWETTDDATDEPTDEGTVEGGQDFADDDTVETTPIGLDSDEEGVVEEEYVTEEFTEEVYVEDEDLEDEDLEVDDAADDELGAADEAVQETGDFGTLAERMAREATGAEEVSPSGRRPWERGSV